MSKASAPSPYPALPRIFSAGRFASFVNVTPHAHDGSELVLVTEGHCNHVLEDEHKTTLTGKAGTLFIMPAKVTQRQETFEFTRTTYVTFRASEHLFSDRPRAIHFDPKEKAMRWLEDLCDAFLDPRMGSSAVLGGLLWALLEWLNDLEQSRRERAELHPGLQAALNVLESNLSEPVSWSDLSKKAHVSPSHLNALFRKNFGGGPLKYRQRLQLEQAKRLLQSPYMRIYEVAEACGFEDANYFVRLFKKRFGISPNQWRKNADKA